MGGAGGSAVGSGGGADVGSDGRGLGALRRPLQPGGRAHVYGDLDDPGEEGQSNEGREGGAGQEDAPEKGGTV